MQVFRYAQAQLWPNRRQLVQSDGVFGPAGRMLLGVLGAADVTETDGLFELSRRRPSNASRRWIIAVRDGRSDLTEEPTGLLDPAWRSVPRFEALHGPDIIDLVACAPDLSRVTARLHGTAAVLGQPQEGWWADAPVRVFATPWQWLVSGGAGVLPIGTEEETQHYLLSCERGVVGNNVAHGEALLRKMLRPTHFVPPVLVAQHSQGEDDDDD